MEDLKEIIEKLEARIDSNTERMISNMNELHSHEDKINANAYKIQQNSYALDILKDYKTGNKRYFTAFIIVLIMLCLTMGYLIYVLNDIGTIERTTNQEVTNVNTISGNVVNGDMYGDN